MEDVNGEQSLSQNLGKSKKKFVKKMMFKLKGPLKSLYKNSSRSGGTDFSLTAASTGTLYENNERDLSLKRKSQNDLSTPVACIMKHDSRSYSTVCEKSPESYSRPDPTPEHRSSSVLERHSSNLSLPESVDSSMKAASNRSLLGSGSFKARLTGFSGDKSQVLGSFIQSKFYSLRTRNVSGSRCSYKMHETESLIISPTIKEGQNRAEPNQTANQAQIEKSETKDVCSKGNDTSTSVENLSDDKQTSLIRKRGPSNLSCDEVADIKVDGVEDNGNNKPTKEKGILGPIIPKNEAINDMMQYVYDKLDFLVDQRTRESKVLWPYIPYPECQDMLMDSFSCAWSKELMTTGRLYITPCWILFFAHFLTKGPRVVIPVIKIKDIKRCDILMLPTGLEIVTDSDCYKFMSFVRRDKCYMKTKKVVEANIEYIEGRNIPREIAVERITKYTESRFRTGTINDMFPYDDNLILRKSESRYNYPSSKPPLYGDNLRKHSNIRKKFNQMLINSRPGKYISSRKEWNALVNAIRDVNTKLNYSYGEIQELLLNTQRYFAAAVGNFIKGDFMAHAILFMLIILCATSWLNRVLEREIKETVTSLKTHPKAK